MVRAWPHGKVEAVGPIWAGTSFSFSIRKSKAAVTMYRLLTVAPKRPCQLWSDRGIGFQTVAEEDLGLRPEPSGLRSLEGGFRGTGRGTLTKMQAVGLRLGGL